MQAKRFSCSCDRRLSKDKSEQEPEHDLSPQLVDSLQLIHATGGQWQRDQFDASTIKSNVEARLAGCFL